LSSVDFFVVSKAGLYHGGGYKVTGHITQGDAPEANRIVQRMNFIGASRLWEVLKI
jgi:hypothetical protein